MQVLTSSNHLAAVARTLRRASANIATVGKAVGQAARLQRVLGPGSFLHDLVVLANPRTADGIRMAAARRLARYHARPKMISMVRAGCSWRTPSATGGASDDSGKAGKI